MHHDDEDTENNHPSNLWVFASAADHAGYHALKRRVEGGASPLWPLEEMLERPPKRLARRYEKNPLRHALVSVYSRVCPRSK